LAAGHVRRRQSNSRLNSHSYAAVGRQPELLHHTGKVVITTLLGNQIPVGTADCGCQALGESLNLIVGHTPD
jgi:hypothetical protein